MSLLTSAATRFMGRGQLQNSDVNRSHEPIGIPLNRPPGTFSPTVEEGRDDGVRFMEWGQAPTTLKRELQRRECPGVVRGGTSQRSDHEDNFLSRTQRRW